MVPLQMLGERVIGWGVLVAMAFGPAVVAAVLWSPFLASNRVRSLFRDLPPGGSLVVSYVAVMVGASVPYVAGFVAALVRTTGESGAVMANAILDVLVPVSIAYAVGAPMLAGFALPRVGIDWDPTGYGHGTWAILGVGSAWYAAIFAAPLFLIAAILAMPMG